MSRVKAALSRRTPVPVRRLVRSGVVRSRHLGLTDRDVLFVSYPKSGSTWLRFVLAQAVTGEPMDFDRVRRASPHLGTHRGRDAEAVLPGSGRLVKSHELPLFAGRARPRVVYLVRDGRDVAASYRSHLSRRGFKVPDFEQFVRSFARGDVGAYGSWQDHVSTWVGAIDSGGVRGAVVRYEDVLERPVPALAEALDRIGLVVPEPALAAAFAANTPEAMRAKESGSAFLAHSKVERTAFVGSARSGGWREQLSPALVADFERHAGATLEAMGYPLTVTGPRP